MAPGTKAKLGVVRGGKDLSLTVTLGSATPDTAEATSDEQPAEQPKLGLTLQALSPDLAQRYGLTEKAGVVITDVDQGSPAAMVGLQEGDLIAEVNRKRVAKVAEFQSAVADARKDGSLLLLVKRKSASLFVVLPLK